ncbi:hypothetical protein FisN_18Hh101 [Fistulifera solaris]|uniref:Uncharacterized protein n=1 Tax=Fistulifera solaris TaxID=1519565 RepID=A0A1Z5JV21_FISSO|nr:hypothetical protein FisN_18Hh101 [Fistulifera solaris]|eukprot:GAX17895.1 hypothetical protein FisN_18Hh101 [Fistulifera solaris]
MAQPDGKCHSLLELIPVDQLSEEQKAFRPSNETRMPLYRMRRDPTFWGEIFHDGAFFDHDLAIWRENRTLLCIVNHDCWRPSGFREQNISFTLYKDYEAGRYDGVDLEIYGKTDATIVETATFFWSLKQGECEEGRLRMPSLPTIQPEQLARIFDANPDMHFEFEEGTWSAEQSVILATRSFPLNVKLVWVSFEDNGTAFVNALETRQQYSFGMFSMTFCDAEHVPLSRENVQRFLKLNLAFEKLEIGMLESECAFLPFSVKSNALVYEIELTSLEASDFESLDIIAEDLFLKFNLGMTFEWDEHLVCFFHRLAELGHFERLRISVNEGYLGCIIHDDTSHVAEALITAITANHKLKCLDLSDSYRCLEWFAHFQGIFKAMEDHKGLREFHLKKLVPQIYNDDIDCDESDGSESEPAAYEWLRQLLSRNRKIVVYNSSGKRCSNGEAIDTIYLLNDILNGSTDLVKESTSLRPLLVATALVESTSRKFLHSALLMSNHADMLCELMQVVNIEEVTVVPEEAIEPEQTSITPVESEDSKRRRSGSPPPPATKKAART